MNKLLDRLKQVDLTTYEKIVSGIPIYPRSIYYVFDPGARKPRAEMYKDGWIRFADLPKEAACAWLQACLQEAISGKGWQGIVLFNKERNRAMIDEIIDGWGGTRKLSEEIGDSAANALLAAYIAACEAMA